MIVAFDVNETLLDLSVLDDPFKEPLVPMRCVAHGSLKCCSCHSWAA